MQKLRILYYKLKINCRILKKKIYIKLKIKNIRVSELSRTQGVIVVNLFSRYGALGFTRNSELIDILRAKLEIHNSMNNMLSTSTIILGQDSLENLFPQPFGFLLKDGIICYAKCDDSGDIGYDPNITNILFHLGADPRILKPQRVADLEPITGPRNGHNELLIVNPEYFGIILVHQGIFPDDFQIQDIRNFCISNSIPLFYLKVDANNVIITLNEIYPNNRESVSLEELYKSNYRINPLTNL